MADTLIRLLHVDDDPSARACVRDALLAESDRFELIEANSRAKLDAYLARGGFDLILSDYNILGFTGLQLLDAVKSQNPDLPVVIVTGTGSEEVAVEAMKRGAADYVTKKPGHIKRLPQIIKDVFEKGRLTQNRKQAEAKLHYQANLPEYISDAVIAADLNFNIVSWNKAAEQIYGWQATEVLGRQISRVMPTTYLNDAPDAVLAQFQKEGLWQGQVIQPHKNGTDIYILASVAMVYDEAGQPTGTVAINRDITRQKQAEESLQHIQARLQMAVQAANVGLWDWDLRTNQVYFSPEWKRQIGYAEDEISNDFNEWQSRVHPDDLEQALATVQAYLQNPWPNYENEFRLRHKDGSYRWILARASLLVDDDGHPYRMLGSHIDLTERKQMEQTLRQNQAHYRSLLESAQGFVIYRNQTVLAEELQGRVIFVSPSIRQIMGVSNPHDIATWFENIHPDDLPQVLQNQLDSARHNIPFNQQMRIYHPIKRQWRWIHAISHPVDVDAGGRVYFNGIIIDITAQKQAEAALRDSETLYKTLVQTIPYGIQEIDTQGTIHFANAALHEIYGYEDGELLGASIFDLPASEAERAELRAHLSRLVEAQPPPAPYQGVSRTKDGRTIDIHVAWDYKRDDQGQVSGFISIITDITKRKQAEDALRRSETRYRQLAESSHDLIWEVDAEGAITFMNAAAKQIYGYEPEEMIGWNFTQLMAPEDVEDAVRVFQEALESGQDIMHYENRVFNRAGEIVILDAHAVVRRDAQGNIIGTIGTSQDITERKRAEAELRQSEQRYRILFDGAPISLWEEDFSAIKTYLSQLRASGVTDFVKYFDDHPEEIGYCVGLTKIVAINQAAVSLYQAKNKEDLLGNLIRIAGEAAFQDHRESIIAIAEGKTGFEKEVANQTLTGHTIHLLLRWTVLPGHEATYARVLVSMVDISSLKQAEQALRLYTKRLETLRQIDRAILAAESIQDIAASALERLVWIVPCLRADVSLFDSAGQWIESIVTYRRGKISLGQGFHIPVAHTTFDIEALRRGQFHQVEDWPALDNLSSSVQAIITRDGLRAWIAVPLIVRGELMGLLGLGRAKPGLLAVEETEMIREVADQLAIAIGNARLLEAERDQRQLAEALSEIARILNSTLSVDEVLDNILTNAGRVVPHEAGDVLLIDEESIVSIVRQQGYDNFNQDEWAGTRYFPLKEFPVLQAIAKSRKSQIIPDTYASDDWVYVPETSWIRSYACAPIFVAEELAGFISLSHRAPGFYNSAHAERLQMFAEQAGFALQNARLYEQVQRHAKELEQRVAERTAELKEQYQKQATLEERQRLARDLHDAVSQTLFSSSLLAESIPFLWERNPEQARQSLTDLLRLNRGALAEMRNLLLELRPAALAEMSLRDLLQQLVNALLGRTRLAALLEVEGEYSPAPGVRVVFYRIAQEALNNITKHAQARQVSINLLCHPKQLTLTIIDDGQGFNPQQVAVGHFGLQIMRERAAAIGASLAIDSEPGRGTKIVAAWSDK